MKKPCKQCSVQFEITQDDLAFYDKVSPVFNGVKYQIPEPSLCPDCRQQRRLTFRNERKLYKRQCDGTGNNMVSVFPEESSFTVYNPSYWHSDKWNPLTFGLEVDFQKSFLDQFQVLWMIVPQIGRSVEGNENCDFVNQAGWNKNCYLIFESSENELVFYSEHVNKSISSFDCSYSNTCELCYECFDCLDCYHSCFLQSCQNCSDSWFLKNCIGCKNCFGSVNLRNKEYYFLNQQLSKEEYLKKVESLQLDSEKKIQQWKKEFCDFSKKFPEKYVHGFQNESSTGDYLKYTQNCYDCYNLWNSQDCRFCSDAGVLRDCYDVTVFGIVRGAVFSYDNHEIGDGCQEILFSDKILTSSNVMYCHSIWNSEHLFGCIGLKHKKYCILNKQYTKEEYEELVPKIIQHMKATGEWGEFFPVELSPFAYNETVANEYFPLTKEEVESRAWNWKEEIDEIPNVTKKIPAERLPDAITEIPDDILNWAIICERSKRPFKIIPQELKFYREQNLPIPHLHPDERHKNRMALRNPRKLWTRNCDKCAKEIKTTYSPERPETVYCEECYLGEVY